MIRRNHLDKQIQRSLELGRENAELLPQVKRWCAHINIEMTSSGLLAQAYHLPIGTVRVTCQHGASTSESMHLDWEARRFILQNCRNCPHHREVSPDNYGQRLLEQHAKAEVQRQQEQERYAELKRQLQQDAHQVLETPDTPRKSINRLVLEFMDADTATRQFQDVSDKLSQAMQLAPEHFSDEALQVLLGSMSEAHRLHGLKIAHQICVYRKEVPRFVFEAASKAIVQHVSTGNEIASRILQEHIAHHSLSDVLPLLKDIILVADFAGAHLASIFRGHYGEIPFPNTIELIAKIFVEVPEVVRKIIEEQLLTGQDTQKFNAAKLLHALLPNAANEILPLTGRLLHSLEDSEGEQEFSADHAVCDLLSHLYAYSPKFVDERISKYWTVASGEVKVLIAEIFARIVRHASSEDRWADPLFPEEMYANHVSTALDKLYTAMTDIQLDPEIRQHISEKFKDAVQSVPDVAIGKLERVLGRLAMTIKESKHADTEARPALEQLSINTSFDGLIQNLVQVIRIFARYDPQRVFSRISQTLHEPTTLENARLKAKLTQLLSEFVEVESVLPKLIPELYRHLVDFDSNLVRSRAIEVTGELLSHVPDSVPSNMVQLLIAYLRDPYVIVHKSATRALRYVDFSRDDTAFEALDNILNLEQYYGMQKDEEGFLEDIFRTLTWSFSDWPDVQRYVNSKFLPKYSRHSVKHFAEDMLVRLARSLPKYPEVAPEFVELAIKYVHETARDRYNYDSGHSDRSVIWNALFSVSAEHLHVHLDTIRQAALSKIRQDPLEAHRFVELLSYKGFRNEALALTDELLVALPDVKSNQYARDTCRLIGAAERAELLSANGEFDNAIQLLAETNGSIPAEKEIHTMLEKTWQDDLTDLV